MISIIDKHLDPVAKAQSIILLPQAAPLTLPTLVASVPLAAVKVCMNVWAYESMMSLCYFDLRIPSCIDITGTPQTLDDVSWHVLNTWPTCHLWHVPSNIRIDCLCFNLRLQQLHYIAIASGMIAPMLLWQNGTDSWDACAPDAGFKLSSPCLTSPNVCARVWNTSRPSVVTRVLTASAQATHE